MRTQRLYVTLGSTLTTQSLDCASLGNKTTCHWHYLGGSISRWHKRSEM
jgi:hypothetical protein